MTAAPKRIRHEVRVPDLDLEDRSLKLGSWLAGVGLEVMEGERIVEIVSADVVVDLGSPADGTIIEQFVADDEDLHVGQILGVIEAFD